MKLIVFLFFLVPIFGCPLTQQARISPPQNAKESQTLIVIDGEMPAYMALLRYQGKVRPISRKHQKILLALNSARPDLAPTLNLYQDEILVYDSDRYFWLPIQSQVLNVLKSEINSGNLFIGLVRLIGAVNNEIIFFLIDFEMPDGSLSPATHTADEIAI